MSLFSQSLEKVKKTIYRCDERYTVKYDDMPNDEKKKYDELINKLNCKLSPSILYITSPVLRGIIHGEYNKGTGHGLAMHHKVVEKLLEVDPAFFDNVDIQVGMPEEE